MPNGVISHFHDLVVKAQKITDLEERTALYEKAPGDCEGRKPLW